MRTGRLLWVKYVTHYFDAIISTPPSVVLVNGLVRDEVNGRRHVASERQREWRCWGDSTVEEGGGVHDGGWWWLVGLKFEGMRKREEALI